MLSMQEDYKMKITMIITIKTLENTRNFKETFFNIYNKISL